MIISQSQKLKIYSQKFFYVYDCSGKSISKQLNRFEWIIISRNRVGYIFCSAIGIDYCNAWNEQFCTLNNCRMTPKSVSFCVQNYHAVRQPWLNKSRIFTITRHELFLKICKVAVAKMSTMWKFAAKFCCTLYQVHGCSIIRWEHNWPFICDQCGDKAQSIPQKNLSLIEINYI